MATDFSGQFEAGAGSTTSRRDQSSLVGRYLEVRRTTEALCRPLVAEDMVVQSMPDASPVRWHLAHSTWFFETFVLGQAARGFRPFHDGFGYLFNSYYNAIGERVPRQLRGTLSRPTVAEIREYRRVVDEQMQALLDGADAVVLERVAVAVVLGLNHEQQHQELILTDIKHAFASNPLRPAYDPEGPPESRDPAPSATQDWLSYPEGIGMIGHSGPGFAFDNETPRHREFLEGFQLASRPVTNGEYQEFIADGGYRRPQFWLSDGWSTACGAGWEAPLYWERRRDEWWQMTLSGMRPVDPDEPVCHVSYFEADAYARWARARLPSEAEWEVAAAAAPLEGNFLESGRLHPAPSPSPDGAGISALYGDVWEWTRSPYTAYPGFAPPGGALGEYNAKFMNGQFVLRGGSCATPRSHVRPTYRNFFPPGARWQFAGFRLARGLP